MPKIAMTVRARQGLLAYLETLVRCQAEFLVQRVGISVLALHTAALVWLA